MIIKEKKPAGVLVYDVQSVINELWEIIAKINESFWLIFSGILSH